MPPRSPELVISSASAWRTWLSKHSLTTPVIWLVIPKSGSSTPGPTYGEVLDEALCHGWIDSGGCSRDETTRYVRFGPRKARSPWSKRNIGFVERLEREGRMANAGIEAVRLARENGMWDAAYSAGDMPVDLRDAVKQAGAGKQWEEVSKKERYAIYVKLGTLPVGSEGRAGKIEAVISNLVTNTSDDSPASTLKRERSRSEVDTSVAVTPVKRATRSSTRLRSHVHNHVIL